MSKTKHYAVIGYPLGYSLSPLLHNHFFHNFHLSADYSSVPLKAEELPAFIQNKSFAGFNVTVPYKETIVPLLDEISPAAKTIGAVNTVTFKQGRSVGTNTDGDGFYLMLKEEKFLPSEPVDVLLLGAGGAARAIVYALSLIPVKTIFVFDHIPEKARQLAQHYKEQPALRVGEDINAMSTEMDGIDLLINASPVGMKDVPGSPLPDRLLHRLPAKARVIDIIYSPQKTLLLQQAERRGLQILNGLGMLAAQGILAEQFWFGRHLTYPEAKEILSRGL
jgi:shikimate dehydrogenase